MEVFISYETTTGHNHAINLKKALEKVGTSAFVADEDIPKGTPDSEIIDNAIGNCTYFVIVITLVATYSEEVKREIELAFKLHKDIIPTKPNTIERAVTNALPIVGKLQQIDFDCKESLADQVVAEILKRKQQQKVKRPSRELEAEVELGNIQTAVVAMMVDNNLTSLPNPVTTSTNDMSVFPDNSVCGIDKIQDQHGNAYVAGQDKDGYILYQHDIIADGNNSTKLVHYVGQRYTKFHYVVDSQGTVIQFVNIT